MLDRCLHKKNHKVTVHEMQKLCGFLNFLCKCIVPGRAFLTRMYAAAPSNLLQHHHFKLNQETLLDMIMWKKFLVSPYVLCRPFLDFAVTTSQELDMYSDASGRIGFGLIVTNLGCFLHGTRFFLMRKTPVFNT